MNTILFLSFGLFLYVMSRVEDSRGAAAGLHGRPQDTAEQQEKEAEKDQPNDLDGNIDNGLPPDWGTNPIQCITTPCIQPDADRTLTDFSDAVYPIR